jgi:hypothetical protein
VETDREARVRRDFSSGWERGGETERETRVRRDFSSG